MPLPYKDDKNNLPFAPNTIPSLEKSLKVAFFIKYEISLSSR